MTPAISAFQDLEPILANRRWIRRKDPFPHVIATDVFEPAFYLELDLEFKAILDRGFGDSPDQFSPKFAHYDAHAYNLLPDTSGAMSVFASTGWHEMLAGIVGVRATGHVNVTFHHHAIGSANGRVHNDLNPGWFLDYPASNGIRLPSHRSCSYKYGVCSNTRARPRELMRAAAMLFYLSNPEWCEGDGGETGLYWSRDNPVDCPIIAVPPVNNSLLLFECTPYSYHSFLQNKRSTRNAVVLWLHREKQSVISRWGESSIVYWPHGG